MLAKLINGDVVGYHATVKEETMGQVIGRNGHYSGQQTYLSEFEEELPWVKIKRVLMELCSRDLLVENSGV